MRRIFTLLLLLISAVTSRAQYQLTEGNLPEETSILNYASILNTGNEKISFDNILQNSHKLKFTPLNGKLGNLGFTADNYWLKFQIENTLDRPILYYLQTAEPVTDNVNLYLIGKNSLLEVQKNGDNLAFSEKSVANRKTIFKIELAPGEAKSAFIQLKNDGEKNSLPLTLLSQERMLKYTYLDQLIMGVFYGILIVIAITYFFFYFALKDISFLYYTLYVVFMGLCQFALDGFYHQYIGTGNSWLSLRAVIISAVLSCFFFGKYSEIILEIKQKNNRIHKLFKPLYIALGLVLIAIVIFPNFLKYSYPIINILTVFGLVLIFSSIAIIIFKKQSIDIFYTIGISILALSIILAILMNFGIFPEDFSTDNITKPGIGLEIIALSLSMASRIGILRNKKEELQSVALQKSEEMNDIKSYFLSNMSHELRTPLTAILGLAAIMEKETTDAKLKSNYEKIRLVSNGLISSVNDILDFSQIEKGLLQLNNNDFSAHEVLGKLADVAQRQTKEKGLAFNYESTLEQNIILLGDSVRLEQIIHNVLGNAIKFTSTGEVRLKAKSTIEDNILSLNITVSDTGIGIPKEKLDKIFELFAQTNSDNKRKYGGFGIGLTIAKALTDLHEGSINIISSIDCGTSCEISIKYPVQKVITKPANTYPNDEHDLLGKHILIVEDNPMNQMIIQMMLEDWKNTRVSLVGDGAQSLEILKTDKSIDLILMDLQMPVMDGYEAISAIRSGLTGPLNSEKPIIVITADVTSITKERVYNIGANGYLNKPVDEELMYQKITEVLSKQPNLADSLTQSA
ncbi:7TM diverse intracellular signaling domain-containing protein [Pedobacter aquatilis]|uniref:hybrid sensor histidine kinase/response regulator n=1 Tax=Pedobacter aquatilis TaxID=351343 RepID=UPI0025B302C6|nr:hybrid sensor histidine kinase/response regulator [Pedobacter aquatilis]MDN3586289.1 7TM diverse intracellular signaling domain-containing protein [Pedobacter aquatilis]